MRIAALLLAGAVLASAEWDPTPPRDPGPVAPIELRATPVDRAGVETPNAGGSRLGEAGGQSGLTVLLHRLPARGMVLLPSPDGRFVACRDALYDLQTQTLAYRASGSGQTLGDPRWWDGPTAVFDTGVVDTARPGTAHPRVGLADRAHIGAGLWTGQLGRGRKILYRLEDPAGGTLQIDHGIAAPGFDLLVARRHVAKGDRQEWGMVAAAVDPARPAVLAAFASQSVRVGEPLPGAQTAKLLNRLAHAPACRALHPSDRTMQLGGLREVLGGQFAGRYLVDVPDADGERIARMPLPGAPGELLTCRWPEDGLGPLGLFHDRLVRWTHDWQRLGWIDAASERHQRPFRLDGTRLHLETSDGKAVVLDLANLQVTPLTSTMAERFRPRVADYGGGPRLELSLGRGQGIPLQPGKAGGRPPYGALADGGGWCRDGDQLHLLAGPTAKLVSLNLPESGRGWLASAAGGRLAVIFAGRILHLDPASGRILREVPVTPPLSNDALPHPDRAMQETKAVRRWPQLALVASWHTTIIDVDSGTARSRPTKELCRPGPGRGPAVFYALRGQLADGRLAFGCSDVGKAGTVRWTALVDPWSATQPLESPAQQATADLEEIAPGLLAAPCEDGLELWNTASQHIVAISASARGAIAVAGDGVVALPRNQAQAATVVLDGRRAPISAFDLVLNRPDIILERIGLAQPSTIALLREAWRRRIVRLGLDPVALRIPANAAELPAVRILDRPTGLTTALDRLDLRFAIDGAGDRAVRVRARIGGITVAETSIAAGMDDRTGVLRGLLLAHGLNRIELAPLTAGGLGIPDRLVLRRDGAGGGVRVAALGVSRYREAGRDLQFAAADARDLASALGGKGLVLTDEAVSRERLPELRAHLAAAGLDDLAVIVVAGHGLVDRALQYRIATFDTAFADPAARGIAVDDLLAALRASPARRRLLLIDTCHAGEVEAGEMRERLARLGGGAGARGLRPATAGARPAVPAPAAGDAPPTPGQVARIQFQDAGSDDGITILAACRGDEASWESPAWGHGAFSAAILEALAGRRADLDGDGAVDLAELGQWLDRRVPELTGGQQHPEVRSGDLDREVVIAPASPR